MQCRMSGVHCAAARCAPVRWQERVVALGGAAARRRRPRHEAAHGLPSRCDRRSIKVVDKYAGHERPTQRALGETACANSTLPSCTPASRAKRGLKRAAHCLPTVAHNDHSLPTVCRLSAHSCSLPTCAHCCLFFGVAPCCASCRRWTGSHRLFEAWTRPAVIVRHDARTGVHGVAVRPVLGTSVFAHFHSLSLTFSHFYSLWLAFGHRCTLLPAKAAELVRRR